MVNNIDRSRASEGWQDAGKTDSTKRRPPQQDTYRKVERDKHKPPSKEEQEEHASVDEKKDSRSIFDLSKKTSPKKGMIKEPGIKGEAATEGALQKLPAKKGDQAEPEFGALEGEPKEEEFAASDAEKTPGFDQTKEPQTADPSKKMMQPQMKQPAPELTASQAAAHMKAEKPVVKESAGEVKGDSQTAKKDKTKGETRTTSADTDAEMAKGAAGAAQGPVQGVGLGSEKAEEAKETAKSATIKELAAQIVDRIQIMKRDDLTSTIITLKSPPELAGSTITLTASDHAKREFNITFANLSPDGKMLLDRKLKEDSLTETLDRKGIIVHNVITTTQPERIMTADAGQAAQDQRQQREDQQEQQKRQHPQEGYEEEETT